MIARPTDIAAAIAWSRRRAGSCTGWWKVRARICASPASTCATERSGDAHLAARRSEARRDIPLVVVRAGMGEPALEIEPDLAANGAPAPAEGVILAEIGAGLGIDHAVEEGVEIGALLGRAREDVDRLVLRLGIGGGHPLERLALDELEAGPGILRGREAVGHFERLPLAHLADIDEAGLLEGLVGLAEALGGALPVDHLRRIEPGDDVLVEAQHARHLLGLEGDIGVDEEEVGGGRVVEEAPDNGAARPGDERVM